MLGFVTSANPVFLAAAVDQVIQENICAVSEVLAVLVAFFWDVLLLRNEHINARRTQTFDRFHRLFKRRRQSEHSDFLIRIVKLLIIVVDF